MVSLMFVTPHEMTLRIAHQARAKRLSLNDG